QFISGVIHTADNEVTARSVAPQVGIDTVLANLLPQEEMNALHSLARPGRRTAMVGDRINDAPALAAADLGFAMGGGAGTHSAMEAADVVIMNDDLRRVPETIRLSRRTHATMWMAVFADMGASLLVVFNGLRLLRPKDEARA